MWKTPPKTIRFSTPLTDEPEWLQAAGAKAQRVFTSPVHTPAHITGASVMQHIKAHRKCNHARCTALTRQGVQCHNCVAPGRSVCGVHLPGKKRKSASKKKSASKRR